MRDLVVLSGSSHPKLATEICRNLSIELGKVDLTKFSNGEISATIRNSVRQKDVFIVQTGAGHVNDNFIQLLIMISACKTSSARRVTAVLPLFPYSRQPDVPHSSVGGGTVAGTPVPGSSSGSRDSSVDAAAGPLREALDGSFKMSRVAGAGAGADDVAVPPPAVRSRSSARIPLVPSTAPYQPTSLPTNTLSLAPVPRPGLVSLGSAALYKQWLAQSGTLIANLLTAAGADHIITLDLHDPQFQGFFDIPVDNLSTMPLFAQYIKEYVPEYRAMHDQTAGSPSSAATVGGDVVVVSPDAGGAKRAIGVADALGCGFALIHKERKERMTAREDPNVAEASASALNLMSPPGSIAVLGEATALRSAAAASVTAPLRSTPGTTTMLVGDVRGKTCILIDDLIDTGSTVCRAAALLKQQGARYVYCLVTHGVFSGNALAAVRELAIDKLVVTTSAPQEANITELTRGVGAEGTAGGIDVEVLDVARLLGEAIRRVNNGESVSMLYEKGW